MRRTLALGALVFSVALLVSGQKRGINMNEDGKAEREVTELEREFGEALTRLDRARLERLMADDFLLTNTAGKIVSKAQVIADITSPDYELESLVNDDISVRIYGDVAVVMARGTAKGRYKGQDAGGQFRYTRVWLKRRGRWQAVVAQSTNVVP
ncbi:MAG TPA: nuclear transport factor 2 family protein [Pyrinomonadaceae bacterium]|nr:nuclear transport factor 2 family protein [Pyrinomonadaceae bacterium]